MQKELKPQAKMTEAQCADLHNAADAAGKAAALKTNTFGGCGFAWVLVKPANCRFARWLNAHGHASKSHYDPGMKLWVSDYGQNSSAKFAYAAAYANVLTNAGITAHADSRLD
jgi:hypothetical protein